MPNNPDLLDGVDQPDRYAALVQALRTAGCVFAEDEARLLIESAGSGAELDQALRRRVAGEPLELILGWVEFCGLRLRVAPGVFVPRQRTAVLVEQALGLAGDQRHAFEIDDLQRAVRLVKMGAGEPQLRRVGRVGGKRLDRTDRIRERCPDLLDDPRQGSDVDRRWTLLQGC